jgi:hypothetical protein
MHGNLRVVDVCWFVGFFFAVSPFVLTPLLLTLRPQFDAIDVDFYLYSHSVAVFCDPTVWATLHQKE